MKKKPAPQLAPLRKDGYATLLGSLTKLLEDARRASARSVNAVMTASYWEMGRRIVEHEQGGLGRAEYGAALLKRLSLDLTSRFGRGFSERNLEQMRLFYLGWPISQTLSAESRSPRSIESHPEKSQTLSAEFHGTALRTRMRGRTKDRRRMRRLRTR